jgi:hypothetical protein
MNKGFFLAQKQDDGTPGRPIGNEDGAIMMFEELEVAVRAMQDLPTNLAPMGVFQVNISFVGEVII